MNQHGFTLIELLLSVAILTLLTGLSLPVYETFVRRNDLDLTTQSIASSIRRAQTYARGVSQDSQWGVHFAQKTVTLFQGTNYATRNQTFDETIPLSGSTSITTPTEVVFSKLTALPAPASTTVVLNSTTNNTRTITVNAQGMVNY